MANRVPLGASTSTGDTGLEEFIGLSIEDICPFGYGEVGDKQNHCAHFVGHALRYTSGLGTACSHLLSKKPDVHSVLYNQVGVLVRVNELYARVSKKTKLDTTAKELSAPSSGLIFVTLTSNMQNKMQSMGDHPRKHVGVLKNGFVYHYGNTADKVRKDTLNEFIKRMTANYGKDITFVTTSLPGTVEV